MKKNITVQLRVMRRYSELRWIFRLFDETLLKQSGLQTQKKNMPYIVTSKKKTQFLSIHLHTHFS